MTDSYSKEKYMLACFLMSLLANYETLYFGAKTSFLPPLNFNCREPKAIGKTWIFTNRWRKRFSGIILNSFYNDKNIRISYAAPL